MTQAEGIQQQDRFDAQILPLRLAIKAMRDSGYKSTAYALAELIDNAQQAGASMIEVLCIERRELVNERERSRLCQIAVLDNGLGMDHATLRMALQFGNGTRLDDRSGIGRFGMGLPNASISQAGRVDVWSWQNGADNALHTYIDLAEIAAGNMQEVPLPEHDPVPGDWREIAHSVEKSGTLVVWSELDMQRLTWKQAKAALEHTERLAGRIYRRFIMDGTMVIRLFAKEKGKENGLYDAEAVFDDPLYLSPSATLPAPFDTKPMFEHCFDDPHKIRYNGQDHVVNVRYSVAKDETVYEADFADRGKTPYGKHANNNIGVSVVRAGREIMLDTGWCIGYDPRERWWGAEVEFPPALDELFGVTNNKQAATRFSALATTDLTQSTEEDEQLIDVVKRLKEDGDLRGELLDLSQSIKRNLSQLRELIKAQGGGRRSSRKTRHDTPDGVTDTVNKGWKKRSEECPIEDENKPPTDKDLDEIRTDLTESKHYSKQDADALVSLIKDAELKVVFLEADFLNSYQLFNVEMKGQVTEITFNRQHPAFDDIFSTVALTDEDVEDTTQEEILSRLTRAVNASKIIFAAWARLEREAGIDRAKKLQGVCFEWGQMAANFLQPEDEL